MNRSDNELHLSEAAQRVFIRYRLAMRLTGAPEKSPQDVFEMALQCLDKEMTDWGVPPFEELSKLHGSKLN
ncbi:hypothetical protein [uncultured Alsobacter sp.]|uniref:hypothetical protein n=1 Tax=uncultured Alsobacter sp. TaxID=1748258 RepID=UPI0025D13E1D|nr:hypothetical protein [uncultured Alsobacter sp.]